MSEPRVSLKKVSLNERVERESILLLGAIYHCQQSPLECHKAILKSALKQAHKLFNLARKVNGKKPI